jgi:uncharacterized membrane protein
MLALRYAYALALAIWLGGMVALGAIVAPATFQTLESREAAGRVLAGAVFGTVLDRFQWVAYACAGVALVTLAVMRVLGPKPNGFAARSGLIVLMLAISLYAGFVVYRQVDAVQHEIGITVSPSTLPETDARRIRFDALHELSTRLMMVNMAGAVILLFWQARE